MSFRYNPNSEEKNFPTAVHPEINKLIASLSDKKSFKRLDIADNKKMNFEARGAAINGLENHPLYSSIKIKCRVEFEYGRPAFNMLVTVTLKDGSKELYEANQAMSVYLFKNILNKNPAIPGLEYYISKRDLVQIPIASPVLWINGDWEMKNTVSSRSDSEKINPFTPHEVYDAYLDPVVLQHFKAHAQSIKQSLKTNEMLRVIDIGAGKGRLAKKIIMAAKEMHIPLNYIFLEPGAGQIEIAKDELSKLLDENTKIQFVNNSLEYIKVKTKVHMALSSGGPLNSEVVSRDKAVKSLDIIQDFLVDDGILIAVGMTPFAVKSKHFMQNGFNILQYLTPHQDSKTMDAATKRQIEDLTANAGQITSYVCQKLSVPEQAAKLKAALVLQLEQSLKALDLGKKLNSYTLNTPNFHVEIRMNPNDAMMFATLHQLPKNQDVRIALIAVFKDFYQQHFGAKHALDISPEYFDDALKAGFTDVELKNVKFISSDAFLKALERMKKGNSLDAKDEQVVICSGGELEVQAWLQHLSDPESDVSFRQVTSETLKNEENLAKDIFKFKLDATFVNAQKVKAGLYTPIAERNKIENANIRQFLIEKTEIIHCDETGKTTETRRIIASIMYAIHDSGKKVYVSDFIVAPDMQNKHLGQAIIARSSEEIKKEFPSIRTAWLISGGDGESEKGKHLYSAVIPLQVLSQTMLRNASMFVNFSAPGAIALAAANRDMNQVTKDPEILSVFEESDLHQPKDQFVNKYRGI